MIIHSNTKLAQLNNRVEKVFPKKEEKIVVPKEEEIKTEKVARKNKVKKDFIEEEVIPSYREED